MNIAVIAARLAGVFLLGAATLAVLRPFLQPMVWAAIVAYCTWPLYRRMVERAKRPGLVAGGFTVAIAVGIGLPVAILLVALADDATRLVGHVREWNRAGAELPLLPDWLSQSPRYQQASEWVTTALGDRERMSDWLTQAGSALSKRLVSVAGSVARNLFGFVVMLMSLFAFYTRGSELAEVGQRLAKRLFPTAPTRFLERIGDSVAAVVFGLLGTAAAQGVLAGLGLAVAGVPSPVALGTATALLSFVPGGSGIICLVAAVWLGVGGKLFAAIGLALWAILVVGTMDNVLRPILISGRGKIPFLLVFFGVIGGLTTFGIIGLFLGPVILSVAFAVVGEYTEEAEEQEEAAAEAEATSG